MTRTNRVVQLLLAMALLGCLCSPAFADPCPTITVDENGNGVLNFTTGGGCGSGAIVPMPGALAPDPGPGGLPSVLTYNLLVPPSLVAGDVLLTDADFGGLRLDVIRFNPAGTAAGYPASLLFYSDNVDGFDSLGDTPSPPGVLYTNVVSIPELGVEGGVQNALYTPGPTDPGFVPGFAVSYNFVSDTPEPGTLGLLGTGLISLVGVVRRKLKG